MYEIWFWHTYSYLFDFLLKIGCDMRPRKPRCRATRVYEWLRNLSMARTGKISLLSPPLVAWKATWHVHLGQPVLFLLELGTNSDERWSVLRTEQNFFEPTRQELCLSIRRKRVNSPRTKGEKGSGTPVVWPGQKLKSQAPLSCGLDKSSRCNTQAQSQDNKMAQTGITERARLNCSKHSFVLSTTCHAVEWMLSKIR